uniref:Uncharacterized protein n=1 Tax=viral metagenome TaxID=1070528 RepID=A0A6M3KLW6_9ZZZZ
MTKIPWTQRTLDVTGGCTKCAAGCKNCWAIREVWRQNRHPKWQGLVEKTAAGLNWTGKIKLFPEMLEVPLRTRKPTIFFVNSKSDLFHPKVPFDYIDKFHAIAALCPQHKLQVLTKRIERAAEYYGKEYLPTRVENVSKQMQIIKRNPYFYLQDYCVNDKVGLVLPNLWLGTSISTQADLDKVWQTMRDISAAIKFYSYEPILELISFKIDEWQSYLEPCSYYCEHNEFGGGHRPERGIDWVIIGCESGPKRRLCSLDDIRDAIQQCQYANVPVFVKQIPIEGKCNKKPEEWPEWARVQEYPEINETGLATEGTEINEDKDNGYTGTV